MQIYRKQLIDFFSALIHKDYKAYCERHHIPQNNDTFLNFLFTKNLFNESTVRRYTIHSEFAELNNTKKMTKSQAVRLLADKYNLSDRTVWNMIRDF